ncbi:histidine kinase [Duganella sp. BJB488]|nr:histidine kinase [Duganella sp. BJB475]RFP13312.1 histidine kinase [Duganella sp. BJB489]RFP17240.1 histidine kinase [Duganella sp. BJB488]RFP25474.1 histidine kinase [Duganella sp. BJB476]RFP31702.1 histidine kinase [Duganella sp. BJB480]
MVGVLIFGHFDSAFCAEKGTSEEAIAMVKKAIAEIKQKGLETTIEEVNDRNGKFVDRDLYVMIYTMTGKNLAHGANPRMVGKDLIDIKDQNGVYFIRERLEIAKTKGTGWQDYSFVNPVSKKIEPKSLYIEKYGDVVITCGVYK